MRAVAHDTPMLVGEAKARAVAALAERKAPDAGFDIAAGRAELAALIGRAGETNV
jgi:hypothetical protein